jgi:putative ABC transport system ATP-binding protein
MAPAPLISLRGVAKTFGSGPAAVQALTGVDLDVDHGDFVAITGASGSGKSTLMSLIGCLDAPSSGAYRLKGVALEALGGDQRALMRRRYMGFVFEGAHLLARASALENVELPLLYRGEPADRRRPAATAALEKVGLGSFIHHSAAGLSRVRRRRVAIARALVGSPEILLADEPTGGLDSHGSAEIMELLAAVNRDSGVTVLMVTHETAMAECARRVVRLRDGRIEGVEQPGCVV